MSSIRVNRCALRFEPPTLVLFYVELSTGKERRRTIPLRNFMSFTNSAEYGDFLLNVERHQPYVSAIAKAQFYALLERVWQQKMKESCPPPNENASTDQMSATLDDSLPLPCTPIMDAVVETTIQGDDITNKQEITTESVHSPSSSVSEALQPNSSERRKPRTLPPINISNRNRSSSSNPSHLGDLPSLTLTPLSSTSHNSSPVAITSTNDTLAHPNPLTDTSIPLSSHQHSFSDDLPGKADFKPDNVSNYPKLISSDPVKSLESVGQAVGKGERPASEAPQATFKESLEQQTFTNMHTSSPQVAGNVAGEIEDTSLEEEVLSEYSEIFSDDDSGSHGSQPLMQSDGLGTLDNINIITDDEDEDFNKMSETDYEQRKKIMEEKFEAQKIKPGDPDFVYDKEVDFAEGKIESAWDDNDSDSDF